MKKLALLAIPMCLVFLLFLAIEDGFSRGAEAVVGRRGRWLRRRRLQGGRRSCLSGWWCFLPQSFHEFLFPLAVLGITIKTATVPQRCLSPAASFDSRQGGISAPQFFRPKAFFGCRLKSTEQGSWRRTVEAEPGSTSAVLESSPTGRKRYVGSGQDWSRCCCWSPWICRGEAIARIARTGRRKAWPWR